MSVRLERHVARALNPLQPVATDNIDLDTWLLLPYFWLKLATSIENTAPEKRLSRCLKSAELDKRFRVRH